MRKRRCKLPFLLPALLAVLTARPARAAAPDVVFILTDDQDAASWGYMPHVQSELVQRGTLLPQYFNSVSLCCPSRTTLLRGQYAHNHGVLTNRTPFGGYGAFRAHGLEASTLATWLQSAAYRTALFGKYLNGYPDRDDPSVPRTHVPPGWSEWYSPAAGSPYSNFDYELNENGRLVAYGTKEEDYLTDVLSRKAVDFIHRADGAPLFLFIATYAPHASGMGSAEPAPRHAMLFPDLTAPRTASFNESDVSDKPAHVRDLSRIGEPGAETIDRRYRQRIRSLQAIDDLLDAVLTALEDAGRLGTAYVFFTSDNGFLLGQHRIRNGKSHPYEESIRTALAVRGPGVPAGAVRPHLAANLDIAPTVAALARVAPPDFVDGRSLLPLLGADPPPLDAWRRRLALEFWSQTDDEDEAVVPEFHAVRTGDALYVEYATGDRELYDLASDPDQLRSLHRTAPLAARCTYSGQVAGLAHCAAAACRRVEDAPAAVPGDCDGDAQVTVDEIVRGVSIALGVLPAAVCEALDVDGGADVSVDELVRAVNVALGTC